MESREGTLTGGVLEDLTLPELVEMWVEPEIDRRLDEIERFHRAIIGGARGVEALQVMPLRGGFCEHPWSIEVLVEVRDRNQRLSRIGAWHERKRHRNDVDAFQRAYEKALAHAIIQLLPAAVWRPWTQAASGSR
jgi:hypothetical protein